jgi:hypothetical protein
MAIITIPTSKVALGFHLCGIGAVLSGSSTPYAFFPIQIRWPQIAESQYIPSPNTETIFVDGFGNSLFFNFPTGSNLGGGIQAFMANEESHNYGEVKIADSSIHSVYSSPYVTDCGIFNPIPPSGVTSFGVGGVGRFDIWWDFENNYPGGFELTVNSKIFGGRIGHYRGITDLCGVTPSTENCRINRTDTNPLGNGPDGTSSTSYFDDGGSATDRVVTIPWKDILAVEAIFVHFVEGEPASPPAPPPAPPPPPPAFNSYVCVQTGPSTFECQPTIDGPYATLEECQLNCGGPTE